MQTKIFPVIPKETKIQMAAFFLKTSVPRILAERKEQDHAQKSS